MPTASSTFCAAKSETSAAVSPSCPEPGLYEGVPFETYRQWDAMNASTLCEGLTSMRRLRAKLDGLLPDSDSPAMRFGRAVHCRLLEPERFVTAFPTAETCGDPKCRHLGRFLTDAGWRCGKHKGKDFWEPADFITDDEAERIEHIRENAFRHREIQEIRKYAGAETSLVFEHCGVRCKARLDKLITAGGGFVLDVKTFGKPVTEDAWAKQIADLHYHVKAAFYLAGVKAVTGLDAEWWWVVVETSPPFDVAAIRMTDFDRQVGAWEVRRLLEAYQRCRESGEWPGRFPELVQHVGLPQWRAKEYACVELNDG